ncbi:hypothetical protein ARMGADRAFT_1121865 [Armillaria gallica]|uniref:Uncharacterized protein n=1 Tax=Armillaria gallica TaxID=47427 RepID=A0A2H3DF48_ARMGA|nr:hypothetical protein ARMGADRAFT_1121865 [Armillaria gallica]
MNKGEYAHLVLTLDTTDYETQPEERAGNWVLSNTDLGDWGLKCVKREPAASVRSGPMGIPSTQQRILAVPTSSQRLNDGECRLCAVEFAHCESAAVRKRRHPSDATSQSTHSSRPPSKRRRTEATRQEVTSLRRQLESEREARRALQKKNSTLEEEVLTLRA